MGKRKKRGAKSNGLSLGSRWLASTAALDVRLATSRDELVAAFELVYRCYVAQGYVQPHPGGLVYHPSYGWPASRTVVAACRQRQVAGTLTVVGDSRGGLPLETTYPHEVGLLRQMGRRVAEISALAIEPQPTAPRIGIFFALTHFMVHYALWRRYDDLVMGVHPRHQRFYERCFDVRPLGPLRPHALVCGSPAVAYRLDLHALDELIRDDVRQAYEAIAIVPTRFQGSPVSAADCVYLCQRAGWQGEQGELGRVRAA